MMKIIVKIALPVFNAYLSMFGILGIYMYAGGKLEDKVGFLIIPLVVAMVYGGYIGYKATDQLN